MTHQLRNFPLAVKTNYLDSLKAGFEYAKKPDFKGGENKCLVPILGFIDNENLANIKANYEKALADPSVLEILMYVDSPGGIVSGIDAFSRRIYENRSVKPVKALVREACSAAYWIASAAQELTLEDETSIAGSIGVIAIHEDVSEALKMQGIQVTEIFAGENKNATSENKPLGAVGKADLKEKVDYLYDLFLRAVSRNRNIPLDRVDRTAKICIGKQCVINRLVDNIKGVNNLMTPEEIQNLLTQLEELKKENEELKKKLEPVAEDSAPMPEEKKEEPVAEGEPVPVEEKKEDSVEQKVAKALANERSRILALDNICIPGFEKIINEAKASGMTAEQASYKMVQEQKKNKMFGLRAESKTVSFGGVLNAEPDNEKQRADMAKMIASAGGKRKAGK